MCAGSPAACEVAKKYNLKFYSDRSFVSANDFIDIQFNQNNWYLKALMLILTPIKVIRKLFFSSMRYSINQGSTYSDLPRHSSDLHVVMPPKSSQGLHDLVTLGSHVSLHKSKAIVESDRKFDDAFIQVCQTLLEEYKIDLRKKRPWLDKVKKSDSIDDHHKKLLENILMWHKDRKSYIPKESSVKINPHLAFPSMLTARFSTDQHNPLWRLNIFSSYSSNEGNDLVEAIKNEHLKTLAELACPIATKFSQDMKNLDCEMKNHELKKDLSIGEDSDHDVDNDPLLSGDGGHPRRRRTNHRRRT